MPNTIVQDLLWDVIPYRNSPRLRKPKLVNQHNETIFLVAVPDFSKDRGFYIYGSLDIRQDSFENTGTAYPVTHSHAAKEWIHQSHRRENLMHPLLPTFLKSVARS
jgi:hypothetical protein